MRCAWLLVVSAICAWGQQLVDASKVPPHLQNFEPNPSEPKLKCNILPIKPRLNFSLRFQAGYVLEVPLEQYAGQGHSIATMFRVTPEASEREPAYFLALARLPEIPPTKATLELGGGYVVGEGKYRVEMLVADDSGRTCTKRWNISAKLNGKENDIPPGMPAGAVDEIALRKWMRSSKENDADSGHRVTILMNVSPILPRRTRLGGYDQSLLLSSLASVVERLPLRSVRLVLFSLDQQREIYRDENFTPARFGRVAQALGTVELGKVDYSVLTNRMGHVDLLAKLIGEARQQKNSDAVLFLGPKPWRFDKAPRAALPERLTTDPPFFYVQFRPFMSAAALTDTIMSAVKHMGGKTFDVYTPSDFAEAIRDVTRALEEQKTQQSAHLQ